MKVKVLLLALAVPVLMMAASAISFAGGSYENPAPGAFQTPDLQGPPGGHPWVALNSYEIGLRGKGDYCKVETIKAESSEQALSIAKDSCPTCRVEDLTGREVAAPSPWDTVPMTEAFCSPDLYTNPASQ